MSQSITVRSKIKELNLAHIDIKDYRGKSLLELLRLNSIPIASSCYGEGICKKCVINDGIISCQIFVKDFIKDSKIHNNIIIIDYL